VQYECGDEKVALNSPGDAFRSQAPVQKISTGACEFCRFPRWSLADFLAQFHFFIASAHTVIPLGDNRPFEDARKFYCPTGFFTRSPEMKLIVISELVWFSACVAREGQGKESRGSLRGLRAGPASFPGPFRRLLFPTPPRNPGGGVSAVNALRLVFVLRDFLMESVERSPAYEEEVRRVRRGISFKIG
jgi:hypothetical protein